MDTTDVVLDDRPSLPPSGFDLVVKPGMPVYAAHHSRGDEDAPWAVPHSLLVTRRSSGSAG